MDRKGELALFNTAAERILGYRAPQVRGKPCQEVFAGLKGRRRDHKDETPLKISARHKDGRSIPLVMTPYVMPDNDSRSAGDGVLLVFQDARDLEKMDNQLRHLDRLQSLDEFAAGIVHEIRNPLAGISTNAQHMAEKIRTSDPFYEEMQDILADVKNIEDIVCRVLDFAHPGKSRVREVPIDDIVKEVLRFSRMPLRRQGVRLLTNLDNSSGKVKVDVSQMQQVLFNIVRNACEAMSKGGELRVSTTRRGADNGHVRVEVEDTGRGIAKECLERIFDPFFSLHGEGTGLGLAISRKIVESHGGQIEVKSKLGKGTKFAVVLPAVK